MPKDNEKRLSNNSITWAKSELETSIMRCSTNHLGNLLVVFYALSKFEYIISDFDVSRGKEPVSEPQTPSIVI